MNTKSRFILILALVLLVGATSWATIARAMSGSAPLAPSGSPTVVTYQGEVRVSGTPYTGDGYFKFSVVNLAGDTTYWSNDGTSTGGAEPTASVQLSVSEGLFSVLLGDTTLSGMTQALTADVFSQPDSYLRVWFSASAGGTFSQLTPDTRIAAVPYALQAQEAADADTVDGLHASAFADAVHSHTPSDITPQGDGSTLDADTVDGLHASQLGNHYQNVVVVAQSGGDYASVQAAIDSITDAAVDNPYLVWVAPGVYSETVTMKPYVHLQGAGQEATVITSTVSSAWPPDQATLLLASDTSLRDLMVGNSGAGQNGIAILATEGTTRTLVADVTARALGNSSVNHAIFLIGSGAGATLQQVTTLAENGDINHGLSNYYGAVAVLRGGFFIARGGERAIGIDNVGGAILDAADVTVLAENSGWNDGMSNYYGAVAVLRGGSFIGRGGTTAYGIESGFNGTRLHTENVTVLAEDGDDNYGLMNYSDGFATLRGGSFTGNGGTNAWGIINISSYLETESVTALGENASIDTYGLHSGDGATATLRGGAFIGRGGEWAKGIYNAGSETMLESHNITALGVGGSTENFGLLNSDQAEAVLRDGSFTGRGGPLAWGIHNYASGTTLDAEGVVALGEEASDNNYGLENYGGADAVLRGGSFTASGGTSTYGIFSHDSMTTLEADSVTAVGENSTGLNFGLENYNSGMAILSGGSFTGSGGEHASGVQNTISATLTAVGIVALAEDGSIDNFGLLNQDNVDVTLHGGSFTARGGDYSYGIQNTISSTLTAENITALAENSSDINYGLVNNLGAAAVLRSSAFTARGGIEATAISNRDNGTMLSVEGVSALGENGSNINRGMGNEDGATATADSSQFTGSVGVGLYLNGGAVYLGVTQLDNGVNINSGGTLTCFQVYDGSYVAYTCP